jgi:hypothetical protein
MSLKVFLTVFYNRSDPKSSFALHSEQERSTLPFIQGFKLRLYNFPRHLYHTALSYLIAVSSKISVSQCMTKYNRKT